MADLILKVDDGGGLENGDVIAAFNRRRILARHSESICHVSKSPFNVAGLNDEGSLAWHGRECYREKRFERTSKYTGKSVLLSDGSETIFSGGSYTVSLDGTPYQENYPFRITNRVYRQVLDEFEKNILLPALALLAPPVRLARRSAVVSLIHSSHIRAMISAASRFGSPALRYTPALPTVVQVSSDGTPMSTSVTTIVPYGMDLPEYLRRRSRHPRHGLFGSNLSGAKWHGGKEFFDGGRVTQAWDHIENMTPRRRTESQYQNLAAGNRELRSHLFVETDDFDDAILLDLEEAETDKEGNKTRARKNKVDWENDLGLNARQRARARNPNQIIDLRGTALNRSTIVRRKNAASTVRPKRRDIGRGLEGRGHLCDED